MPLVSVIMPVYNAAPYIGEAIESIIHQTFRDWELLIIDDGSTDNSMEVASRYLAMDDRIRLLRNDSGVKGAGPARNTGIEKASGRYIAMMDADDTSVPERLAVQVAYMEAHPETVLSGCWAREVGKSSRLLWPFPYDTALKATALFRAPFVCATVIFRRDGIKELYPAHFSRSEDTFFCTMASLQYPVANIPRVLYYYRRHADSLTHRVPTIQQRTIFPELFLRWQGFSPTDPQLDAHISWRCDLLQASLKSQLQWVLHNIVHGRYTRYQKLILVIWCAMNIPKKIVIGWSGDA